MADIDEAKVEEFVELTVGAMTGAGTAQMAYLGDRLGLYRALAAGGAATPGELAERTGCAERYLAEWLAQQAAAGFVTYDGGRFTLPPEHAFVLADDDSPAALAGLFEAMAGWHHSIDVLTEAFRTGRGIPWDAHDRRVHDGIGRFFGTAYRASLVSEWVPALGLDAVLRRGAQVADVGCGHGISTVLLAEAYPRSRFVGVDNHAPSIESARRRAAEAGVSERTRFEVGDAAELNGGPYDVIWFFDSLHDLGDPAAAAAGARRRLADQGVVALVEPFAHDDLAENLAGNPSAGLSYAASAFLCVPHALSEPGKAALGAQAGGRVIAETLRAAGLTRTERVAATPEHAVYAVRP